LQHIKDYNSTQHDEFIGSLVAKLDRFSTIDNKLITTLISLIPQKYKTS
jgi:hypothetical protein